MPSAQVTQIHFPRSKASVSESAFLASLRGPHRPDSAASTNQDFEHGRKRPQMIYDSAPTTATEASLDRVTVERKRAVHLLNIAQSQTRITQIQSELFQDCHRGENLLHCSELENALSGREGSSSQYAQSLLPLIGDLQHSIRESIEACSTSGFQNAHPDWSLIAKTDRTRPYEDRTPGRTPRSWMYTSDPHTIQARNKAHLALYSLISRLPYGTDTSTFQRNLTENVGSFVTLADTHLDLDTLVSASSGARTGFKELKRTTKAKVIDDLQALSSALGTAKDVSKLDPLLKSFSRSALALYNVSLVSAGIIDATSRDRAKDVGTDPVRDWAFGDLTDDEDGGEASGTAESLRTTRLARSGLVRPIGSGGTQFTSVRFAVPVA